MHSPETITFPEVEKRRKLLQDRGICVIIPTYNNAGTLCDVVCRAQQQCCDVIVVCDGCTDGSVELLRKLPVQPEILEFKQNRGKGAALRSGFEYALSRGFSYAITLDSDGQHYPEDIPVLLQANIDHPGALIVGSRMNLESVDRRRGSSFANRFSNFWFTLQTFRYLPDTQTGYRLYPLKKLKGLRFLTSRYEAELELLVLSSWHGVKLVSVPVRVYYPPKEQRISHFRPGMDFGRISLLNAVLCFLAIVYGLPLCLGRGLLKVLRTFYTVFFYLFFVSLFITPGVFIYLKLGPMTERKKENLHRLINWMARFVLFKHGIPGVKYSEHIPQGEEFSKPAVIICNHQSHFDLVPMLALTPKMIVLTANWVYHNPLYGFLIRSAGFLPASAGIDALLPQLTGMVQQGYSICIYPEGTRSLDGRVQRFHKGAFYLADQLGIDVLPVVLYGTGKVLRKHGRIMQPWPVHLEVCPRVSPHPQVQDSYMETASSMRAFYREQLSTLANRIERDV